MKVKIVPCILAVAATALITFGLYSFCRCEELRLLLVIFGGISLLVTMGATFALSLPDTRTTINARVLSGVFVLMMLISNVVFCMLSSFSVPVYVIINGLLLLVWLAACYGIARTAK